MRTRKHRNFWLATSLALGACGEPDEQEASGPVPLQDFGTRVAEVYCSGIAPCCAAEGYEATNCKTRLGGVISARVNEIAAQPGVRFDEAVAGRCVDVFATIASHCDQAPGDYDYDDYDDNPCRGMFVGTTPLGGACTSDVECAGADGRYTYCDGDVCTEDTGGASIEDTPRATLGQPCNGTCQDDEYGPTCSGAPAATPAQDAVCWVEDGVTCNTQAGVCEAVPTIGQPCDFYCESAGHCEAGTCLADTARGLCQNDSDCLASSYCDYDEMRCTPLKANGEPCVDGNECLGGECENDRCRDFTSVSVESCAGLGI